MKTIFLKKLNTSEGESFQKFTNKSLSNSSMLEPKQINAFGIPFINRHSPEKERRIIELRQQRKDAIIYQDYDTAKEIDEKIKVLNYEYDNGIDEESQKMYRNKLIDLIKIYDQRLKELNITKQEQEFEIRTKINIKFQMKKKEHINQLVFFEREKAEAIIRAKTSPFDEYELLILQSKYRVFKK